MLSELDVKRAELAARFPEWIVWFVPHAYGGVTWCAQRKPTLNAASPDELERAIAEAESQTRSGEHG
jgi:hypothetical protein